LSKTIVAADLAGAGIAWTEPRDLSVEEFVAAVGRTPSEPDVRPVYPGGVMCLFGDGHVQFIPSDTPPETLRALCTRSGGEEVALPFDY
jgi:prepilin-type processing-associated H-X9-DG protein